MVFQNGYHFTNHCFWQCLSSSSTDFTKFANSFTNRRCSPYPSASFRCFLSYPMQSSLNWKVGFSSLYFMDSRVKLVVGITFFVQYKSVGRWRRIFVIITICMRTTPADSILSLTNLALFRFRLVALKIAEKLRPACQKNV